MIEPSLHPLLVIAGPTASGKSTLALQLAEQFGGEILSCDSVAVYRGMDVGAAKPSMADRARIPHYGLDLYEPNEVATAGDYARAGRAALAGIRERGRLPIVAGGTGLYLRALLEGLAPAPPRDEDLRDRLRERATRQGVPSLHRILQRLDPTAAGTIHPNDLPKIIRSLEVTLLARRPQTAQWSTGREPLQGFRALTMLLDPLRAELHARINARAARMFAPLPDGGLLEEAAALRTRYGDSPQAFRSLGYAQALQVLSGHLSVTDAITQAQAGHRQYAKRQLTWFRNQLRGDVRTLRAFGDDPVTVREAGQALAAWLVADSSVPLQA